MWIAAIMQSNRMHTLNPNKSPHRSHASNHLHRRRSPATIVCSSKGKGGLRILEWTGKSIPQGPLVKTAKFGWKTLWETFMVELAPRGSDGAYARPQYSFADKIGSAEYPLMAGRYRLYLGNPCPWCHRVEMALKIAGLQDMISVVRLIDDPEKASRGGWVLPSPDLELQAKDLRQVYDACTPGGYTGRCTAPCLVDITARRIVCNDSSTIMRNLNDISTTGITLRPPDLIPQIDTWNDMIYDTVNNGVYKSGFSTTQTAYEAAQTDLYTSLDKLETALAGSRFLCGERVTEADIRLFPTAVRFDTAYTTLFKCSRKRWRDYPNLQAWLCDMYMLPTPGGGVLGETVDVDDCRRSYFQQLFPLNPGGIVPTGPTVADLGLGVESMVRGRKELQDVYHMV